MVRTFCGFFFSILMLQPALSQQSNLEKALDDISHSNLTPPKGFIFYEDGGHLWTNGPGGISKSGFREISKQDIAAVKAAAEAKGLIVSGYSESVGQKVKFTCYRDCAPLIVTTANKEYAGLQRSCVPVECRLSGEEKSFLRLIELSNKQTATRPNSVVR